jgi:hypothetical protein
MKPGVKIFCFIVAALLLTYTILRGFKLSFTHDESFTYLYCSQDSFMEIISNRTTLISANNHILNTLFIKLFDNTIGSSEIALRLHSIIAHIIYLIFTFLLVRNLKSAFLIISGFIILNANPYLLEFFSLARGYALAISFMVAGIYFFIKFIKTEKQNYFIVSLILACLASLSNFALLNFLAAIIIIHQVTIYVKYKSFKINLNKSKPVLYTVTLMAIICYEPLRKLIKYQQLNFGGKTGLWDDTAASLIDTFLYKKNYNISVFQIIQGIILFVLIVYSIMLLYKLFKNQLSTEDKTGTVFLNILLMILGFNSLQHYLLDSPYFVERFALFISPLFFFTLIFFINSLWESGGMIKIVGSAFSFIILTGMVWHMYNSLNITHATNWDYDADTRNMIVDLIKEKEKSGKEKITLGVTWLYEPTVNFYKVTKKLSWLETVNRKGIKGNYNFSFYYPQKNDSDSVQYLNKKIIRKYYVSKAMLLK